MNPVVIPPEIGIPAAIILTTAWLVIELLATKEQR